MKKFINNVDDFLKESLNGFGKAHSDIIKVNFEPNFISRKTKTKEGKVSLISGGGSGHEPMHGGCVGHGCCQCWMTGSPGRPSHAGTRQGHARPNRLAVARACYSR